MIDLAKGRYWDVSWSPVKGCAPNGFGTGCRICWAARLADSRLQNNPDFKGTTSSSTRTGWSGKVNCCESQLKLPNGKPKVIALNWMGELFNPKVPEAFIEKVFSLMMLRRQHTFLLLTKNPGRLVKFMNDRDMVPGAVEHIWFGTSASTQKEWDKNVKCLLKIESATYRWVSLEPMLEEVDILSGESPFKMARKVRSGGCVDWIAMGAESGLAPPMKFSWAENVIDDGQAVGIPVFYKQGPDEFGATFVKAPSVFGSPHLEFPFT